MSGSWLTKLLGEAADVTAPDGSEVRILAATLRGSMAHFQLGPHQISKAVAHRSIEELWYVVGGRGRMWRARNGAEEVVELHPGVSLSIPVGTRFQFRNDGGEPLAAIGVTMPPWPGEDEAYETDGAWDPTV